MAKRVTITTELTAAELRERYRSAINAVERTHWHILWLMKEGHSPNEIASLLGYTARWIRMIVGRYNREGEEAISDHRLTLPGAPCLLTAEQQEEPDHALDQPPADGGLWSGPKVAAWMVERLERPVDPSLGGDYLQRLGRSTRVPRPQHEESDEATQQTLKKNSPKRSKSSSRRIQKPGLNSGVKMSTASVSSRSCVGSGPAREPECGP